MPRVVFLETRSFWTRHLQYQKKGEKKVCANEGRPPENLDTSSPKFILSLMSNGGFIVWNSVCFISMVFPCFSPRLWCSKETDDQMFYISGGSSRPPIPKRFLEFLYLTKISYRERLMNHESGASKASGSRPLLPFLRLTFRYQTPACRPLGSLGKLFWKMRCQASLAQELSLILWWKMPVPGPQSQELE